MPKVSIAIPTYERVKMLFESFAQVHDDERVDEIVIVDDASSNETFESIRKFALNYPKVKLYRNANNRGCYENKYTALSWCSNDWCILLDSDNVIDVSYLDAIFSLEWNANTVYAPVFAKPNFDYREFSGLLIEKKNVSKYIDKPMFSTALNTANFFVNKKTYLSAWCSDVDPVTADSIFMCYKMLQKDVKIFFVPNLIYFHRVHSGSHYIQNVNKTPPGFLRSIENDLRTMK